MTKEEFSTHIWNAVDQFHLSRDAEQLGTRLKAIIEENGADSTRFVVARGYTRYLPLCRDDAERLVDLLERNSENDIAAEIRDLFGMCKKETQ